jgi:TusA-related sulfurtransferase
MTNSTVIEKDVRGQICPSCLLIALRELNDLQAQIKSGQHEFHILTDNRHSTTTIPNAVNNMGYTVNVNKEAGYYRIIISRAGNIK